MHMLTLQQLARALGGEVSGSQILAPGPGHSPKARPLSIKLEENAPGGFLVHSFSGDDPILCKNYVREKLNLPTQPLATNARSKEAGKRGKANSTETALAIWNAT